MTISPAQFHNLVWKYYKEHRRDFPWRNTTVPYRVFISEVMLQQTQAHRVVPKYLSFIRKFPTFKSLAAAPLKEVLKEWKGLGYNRRALNAKRAAEIVVREYKGKLPKDPGLLANLPGIGKNTAGSIAAFAYNLPVPFIETNIRSVYIHVFFAQKESVSDKELFPLIEKTLDRKNPREWYFALMDYGVHLKRLHKNPSQRSKHYSRQSPFKGSRRELRSKILSYILENPRKTLSSISRSVSAEVSVTEELLARMEKEGFVVKKGAVYYVE